MTIKRDLKSEAQHSASPSIQKKPKANNCASVCGSTAAAAAAAGEVHSSSDLNFNANANSNSASTGEAPLFPRSSRGRVQKPPSKFNDSVLFDSRKKNNNGGIRKSGSGIEVGNSSGEIGKKGKEIKCDLKTESDNGFDEFGCDKNAESFKSIKTTVSGSELMLVKTESENGFDEKGKKEEEVFELEEFGLGDVVWAKCGKSNIAWPAVVIDPISQAPESVLRRCVPGAICVMFFGYSNAKLRDYAWVKQGMVFPFLEFMDRFQGQTRIYKSQRSDFHKAVEEAILANNDILDPHFRAQQNVEGEGSCAGQEYHYQDQDTIFCYGCGLTLPCKTMKEIKDSSCAPQHYCKPCAKLLKSKQYCGICKKVWHHLDAGDWVRCDGCNVWVHAECDKISSKLFKDLENIEYHCPDCKGKMKRNLSEAQTNESKIKDRSVEKNQKPVLPETLAVVCNHMKGIYFPRLHQVMCECGSCGSKKHALPEWERHVGCRAKKWRLSVKVEGTMQPLIKWITEFNSQAGIPSQLDQKQVLSFLQEKYEPVCAKWTTERCAVCKWFEDEDVNNIIICNRCQIAVHQECYGARQVQDFNSWVCRVCETPDVERECCLCPVKGGALKPTDVELLWVHVTCAWFRPEVSFEDEKAMEPASGILKIPPNSFLKTCVICKQSHGSCTRCCKCETYFHAMCALRMGYSMTVRTTVKKGTQVTKNLIYCAVHRVPNPDSGVFVYPPLRTISPRTSFQKCNRESKLISSNSIELLEPPSSESNEVELLSAARCRVYRKFPNKDCAPIIHLLGGPNIHSLSAITQLNSSTDAAETFSSFKERLHHLQKMENYKVCLGKSAIQGWGLFARRDLQEGEMVVEYRGEQIRGSLEDSREARHRLEGKDCYVSLVKIV
ncbi:histone-lysine N-methyltransferase ATX3-like isoform X1 [Vicia villosa]|uniref:histone-lysine N-methyltransferase ATX3-like isoform X1 n=1 Tax=Vicia villosa TaxID=3911 RepID=UPI00273B3969|nr:histone-lysine N-methyltransferase ATX3-like isoform X1 [Vicia villosa]